MSWCVCCVCCRGTAWAGTLTNANDMHSLAECSNKGLCDRKAGVCLCDDNFDGLACERTICVNDCSNNGECVTLKQLAAEADREYSTPWDSVKQVGCLCDLGFRGLDCSQSKQNGELQNMLKYLHSLSVLTYMLWTYIVECPTGPDPLKGFGNEAGRDCSGRGICNYRVGLCLCFTGFYGGACEHQVSCLAMTTDNSLFSKIYVQL